MLTIPKSITLQQAADDVGVIAETVETLSKLMDKFHAKYGSALGERLDAAFPAAIEISTTAVKNIFALERALTPPDEA